jgi:hypothetical protein
MKHRVNQGVISENFKYFILISFVTFIILPILVNVTKVAFYKVFFKTIAIHIISKSGTCPKSIGVWTSLKRLEGGGEHTMIANTLPLAETIQLTRTGKNFVHYEAKLKPLYAFCQGYGNSHLPSVYHVQLQDGKLLFQASKLPALKYQGIDAYRPFIRWEAYEM